MKKLFWVDGRFRWWLILCFVAGTAFLMWFDWYWRTHDTSFAEMF